MDSEVGTLRAVLVHRPGLELRRMTPRTSGRLLFRSLPWAAGAQREHDAFTEVLRGQGVEVLYITELLQDALEYAGAREEAIRSVLARAGGGDDLRDQLGARLGALATEDLAQVLIAGLTAEDLPGGHGLAYQLLGRAGFVIDPLPNLVFARDSSFWVGDRAGVASLASRRRRREADLLGLIYGRHPRFSGLKRLYGPELEHVHGGDVLMLAPSVLAIGVGQRTRPAGAERLARRVLDAGLAHTVLAIPVDQRGGAGYLDNLCTVVDSGMVLMHPATAYTLTAHVITAGLADLPRRDRAAPEGSGRAGSGLAGSGLAGSGLAGSGLDLTGLAGTQRDGNRPDRAGWAGPSGEGRITLRVSRPQPFLEAAASTLGIDRLRVIETGLDPGGRRGHWDDGGNALALAPGLVVCHERSTETAARLEAAGVTVIRVPGSELASWRGGPRGMACPVQRDPAAVGERGDADGARSPEITGLRYALAPLPASAATSADALVLSGPPPGGQARGGQARGGQARGGQAPGGQVVSAPELSGRVRLGAVRGEPARGRAASSDTAWGAAARSDTAWTAWRSAAPGDTARGQPELNETPQSDTKPRGRTLRDPVLRDRALRDRALSDPATGRQAPGARRGAGAPPAGVLAAVAKLPSAA